MTALSRLLCPLRAVLDFFCFEMFNDVADELWAETTERAAS